MKRKSILAFLIAIFIVPLVHSQEVLRVERARVFARYGRLHPRSFSFPLERTIGRVFQQRIFERGARALRLHFVVQSSPDSCSWAVRVLDTSRQVRWSYSSLRQQESDFWSDEIPGDTLIVEIYSIEERNQLKLSIDRIAISTSAIKPAAITPPDNRVPILRQSSNLREWGESVARLRFIGDDGSQYVCTGFLVSRDLFMTNHHCIRSEAETRSALVDFDYDSAAAQSTTLRFKQFIMANEQLDFALLRLEPGSNREPLRLDVNAPGEQSALIIIQHPGGEPKQVSILDCRVKGKDINGVSDSLTDFGHLCDTLGGSSGSPVQGSQTGKVLGLHHLGFLPTSNRLVNQAVKISLIVDYIRKQNPEILSEIGIQ